MDKELNQNIELTKGNDTEELEIISIETVSNKKGSFFKNVAVQLSKGIVGLALAAMPGYLERADMIDFTSINLGSVLSGISFLTGAFMIISNSGQPDYDKEITDVYKKEEKKGRTL